MRPREMADDVQIRMAAAHDVDAIHALEEAAFPAPWRREFFETELHASGRLNLVAARGPHLLGYLFAMWFFDEMHVNKIAVVAEERRKGIADTLMANCFDFARKNRIKSISLEVRQSNSGAQEFYRSLSFAPTYVRPRYYPDGEAAVVMTRKMS
ncbi:MAG: rimI [Acidobacteria bacterium]|nr:rimI [Acidobacteriota bacterium]